MSAWRRTTDLLGDLLDRLREPGWPRRIAVVAVIALVLWIPYPLSITGDFEVISLRPRMVRNQVAVRTAKASIRWRSCSTPARALLGEEDDMA